MICLCVDLPYVFACISADKKYQNQLAFTTLYSSMTTAKTISSVAQ
jgi:hypothetical protein